MYGLIIPLHFLDIYFPYLEATNGTLCLFFYAGNNFVITTCNLNILFITIDRYIAIVYPFVYVRHGNSLPYLRWFIGAIWLYTILTSASCFAYNKWNSTSYCLMELTIQPILLQIFTLPLIMINLLVTILAYVHIYCVILRHRRQIDAAIPTQVKKFCKNNLFHILLYCIHYEKI